MAKKKDNDNSSGNGGSDSPGASPGPGPGVGPGSDGNGPVDGASEPATGTGTIADIVDGIRKSDGGSGNVGSDAAPGSDRSGAGSGARKRGRGRPPGSRNGSGRRSAGTTGSGAGSGAPEGQKIPLENDNLRDINSGPPPRKVRSNVVEDEQVLTPLNTRELIEDVYTGLFWLPSEVLKQPHWELQNGEEKLLAERTQVTINSLGKRRAKRAKDAIDTYLPGLSLFAAFAMIVASRVKQTQEINRGINSRNAQQERAASGPGYPAGSGDGQPVAASDAGATSQNGFGDSAVRERSLTASDIAKISGRDAVQNFG